MSDPKKRFICKARKHIIIDTQRPYGKDSDCPLCQIESRRNLIVIENKVNFYEPIKEKR